jgi:hypothetical protein
VEAGNDLLALQREFEQEFAVFLYEVFEVLQVVTRVVFEIVYSAASLLLQQEFGVVERCQFRQLFQIEYV